MTPLSAVDAFYAHGCKLGALIALLAIIVYFVAVTAPKRWHND